MWMSHERVKVRVSIGQGSYMSPDPFICETWIIYVWDTKLKNKRWSPTECSSSSIKNYWFIIINTKLLDTPHRQNISAPTTNKKNTEESSSSKYLRADLFDFPLVPPPSVEELATYCTRRSLIEWVMAHVSRAMALIHTWKFGASARLFQNISDICMWRTLIGWVVAHVSRVTAHCRLDLFTSKILARVRVYLRISLPHTEQVRAHVSRVMAHWRLDLSTHKILARAHLYLRICLLHTQTQNTHTHTHNTQTHTHTHPAGNSSEMPNTNAICFPFTLEYLWHMHVQITHCMSHGACITSHGTCSCIELWHERVFTSEHLWHMHEYMYIYMYMYIFMYIYIYIYICIYGTCITSHGTCSCIELWHERVFTSEHLWHMHEYHAPIIGMCDMTHSCAWRDPFMCVTWLIPCVWRDLFMSVTWLIHVHVMTHSYVWRDSSICVTWLIHMCDVTHSYV